MIATVLLMFVPLGAPPAEPPANAAAEAISTRALATWVGDLRNEDYAKQRAAADALIKAGPKAKDAVPMLVKLVGEKGVRTDQIADVLAAIGPDAKEAVPALIAELSRSGGFAAGNISIALAKIDSPKIEATRVLLLATARCTSSLLPGSQVLHDYPGPVVGHLIALCGDKEAQVRVKAADVLSNLKVTHAQVPYASLYEQAGDAAKGVGPALEKMLTDDDWTVRLVAARAITHVAPELADKALSATIAVAVEKVGKTKSEPHAHDVFAPVPGPAAQALIPLLDHPSASLREWAVRHLGALNIREPIEDALKNGKTVPIRTGAARAIAARYAAGAESGPALTEALKDSEFPVRFAAAEALVRVGAVGSPLHAAAIPVLIESLQHTNEQVRIEASQVLLRTGATAKTAVPELTKLLTDPKAEVRLEAALALVGIDPKGSAVTVPALTEGLTASDISATRAARALIVLGPVAKDAVPALAKCFGAKYPQLRMYAAEAAVRIDPEQAPKAVDVLVGLLKNEKYQWHMIRNHSLDVLRTIGPAAKPALPTLAALLKDDGPFHTSAALTMIAIDADGAKAALDWARGVLGKPDHDDASDLLDHLPDLGAKAAPLVPELVKLLDAKANYSRRQAIAALGAIGPDAKDALPQLKKAAESDPRPDFRKFAAEAIKKIEAK